MITGTAIAVVFYNLRQRHPTVELFLGISIGVASFHFCVHRKPLRQSAGSSLVAGTSLFPTGPVAARLKSQQIYKSTNNTLESQTQLLAQISFSFFKIH
ncbi:hypothetical protein LWI28_007904 [Acer negundo]|uniref:Uncharacterized protein n=1 Tax=Acer negundo TaxID=4023 RepID=A0AAD5ITV0_ACENE|nr:hypothetical protein LWI28_007904 [Acer negundo]